MTVIQRAGGRGPDDWTGGYQTLSSAVAGAGCDGCALEVGSDDDIITARKMLVAAPMIRVLADPARPGRGLKLARSLRKLGFTGRLRLVCLLDGLDPDEAWRAGADEIEPVARVRAA